MLSTGGVDRTGCLEDEEGKGEKRRSVSSKAYPNRVTGPSGVWEKALA
jgi:hypothetical protein